MHWFVRFTESCTIKIKSFFKSLRDEFLPNFQNVGTKSSEKDVVFKKILIKYMGSLRDLKWHYCPNFSEKIQILGFFLVIFRLFIQAKNILEYILFWRFSC